METSPKLGLPYIMPQQAQKHVTVNEAVRMLDGVVQLSVAARSVDSQPENPAEGDGYILPDGASGTDWQQFGANTLALYQDGHWINYTPQIGWRAWVEDEGQLAIFTKEGWIVLEGAGGGDIENLDLIGINTQADSVNRFAVKSDAILFSHDDVTPGSGDLRHVFNKSAPERTGSLLFQTGFSGRIEIGLLGNDDLTIQVSDDGQNFRSALTVDHTSGHIGIGSPAVADSLVSMHRDLIAEGGQRIVHLRQTSNSVAGGVLHVHNDRDNVTPILKCSTNTRTVLEVPAAGPLRIGAPIRLHQLNFNALPPAANVGGGAIAFLANDPQGASIIFSDGSQWRRMHDRSVLT